MPKMRSKSAVKKRFKKVGNKKAIKCASAFRRHLLTKKSRKTKRQLRKTAYIDPSDLGRILKLMPY